jgi:hypothetical protein
MKIILLISVAVFFWMVGCRRPENVAEQGKSQGKSKVAQPSERTLPSKKKDKIPKKAEVDLSEIHSIEEMIEKELEGAKVDTSDLSTQLDPWIVKEADITGQWDSSGWHDGPHLTIMKRADGQYSVVFHARGDLLSWTLKRTASFRNGVLEFNRPVKEYLPLHPYKFFYLLKIKNELRFASHSIAKEYLLNKNLEKLDSFADEYILRRDWLKKLFNSESK